MWLSKQDVDKYSSNTSHQPDSWYVNCGGYALGVNSWYQLGPTINWFNDGLSRCTRNGGWREFERACVRHVLKDNPELRLLEPHAVDNIEVDLDANEIIAFRISRSWFGSYHFMRCESNGDWTEKLGHRHGIYRHPYEDIHEAWDKSYDGREYFFVRPRKAK